MRKTFQDKLLPILKERWPNDESDVKRHLKEASTPAAQTLITSIQQWHYKSRNIALGRLIECSRWNDKGELVLERDCKGNQYPLKVPLAIAWELYVYGDQRAQYFPSYSFDHVKHIPDNVTDDWAGEIKEMFHDINGMPLAAFKIIALGRCVKYHGVGNPYTFAWWDRQVSEFQDAQKAIDAWVKDREGWKYLTTTNLQDHKHKVEMSKVLSDILAKADELVEPSIKAIGEADKRLYARQDCTQARNDIKTLRGFFKKYGYAAKPGEMDVLNVVGKSIDDVEAPFLKPLTGKE